MRDDRFTTPSGIVNLHRTKGTHWVMFSDKFHSPPTNILNHNNKGIYAEYQIQKNVVQHIVCMCYISQI